MNSQGSVPASADLALPFSSLLSPHQCFGETFSTRQPLWLEVLLRAAAAAFPCGIIPVAPQTASLSHQVQRFSRCILMMLASDLAEAVMQLIAFLGELPNLRA